MNSICGGNGFHPQPRYPVYITVPDPPLGLSESKMMHKESLTSVVIPAYNAEAFLERTLRSAQGETSTASLVLAG